MAVTSSRGDGSRVPGIGAPLPEGERLLWTGKPDLRGLVWRVFHLRAVLLWFGLLVAWRVVVWARGEAGEVPILADLAWIGVIALAATGLLVLFAWLTRRTTVYALTNRRVLMKIGVALEAVLNVPLHEVHSASWRSYGDGTGDIALETEGAQRVGYALLWPHARPWKWRRPEPSLRVVPDVERVAELHREAARAADPGRDGSAVSESGASEGEAPPTTRGNSEAAETGRAHASSGAAS